MSDWRPVSGWWPTVALERALLMAGGLALLAVAARRPDLVVLATPFAVGTVLSLALAARSRPPAAELSVQPAALLESDELTVRVRVTGAADVVSVALPGRWFRPCRGGLARSTVLRARLSSPRTPVS